MSTTVLPELAAESAETAERFVRLSAEQRLDAAEAEYILAAGVAAIRRVPHLWPIIRRRIGAGTTATTAQQLLTRLLEAVDRNLTLAGVLKESARLVHEQTGQDAESFGLTEVEGHLQTIRAEAVRLLKMIELPAQWPGEEVLKKAKDEMQRGSRLNSDQFRRTLLDQ